MGHFRISNENEKIWVLKIIKRILILILFLILVIFGFYCCRYGFPYPENPNSIIPDRELELVIRGIIKKSDGTIEPSDCLGIKELDISKTNYIKNLKGLEYFTDLERLTAIASWVNDLSSLSSLTKLKYIDLCLNDISDLSPLSNLVDLEYLNLYDNKVKDISPLLSLTKLNDLIIDKNPVTNIDLLKEKLPDLKIYLN